MTPEELNTAIYHKMEAEQDSYRDWLLTLPPDEILQHAYEYAVRQDIPVHPIRHTTFRAVMLRFCHCKRKSIPRR